MSHQLYQQIRFPNHLDFDMEDAKEYLQYVLNCFVSPGLNICGFSLFLSLEDIRLNLEFDQIEGSVRVYIIDGENVETPFNQLIEMLSSIIENVECFIEIENSVYNLLDLPTR